MIYTLFEILCRVSGLTDNLQQRYEALGVVYKRSSITTIPPLDTKYQYYPNGWVGFDQSWRDDVDSLGFTGNPLLRSDSTRYRVLGLGDSFTEGCCPDSGRSFGQLLADDERIAFYNTGLNGAGVFDYRRKAERLIPKLDSAIDAVAILWCWNDVSSFRFREEHPLRYYFQVDGRSAIIPGGIVNMEHLTNYYNADTASTEKAFRFYREINAVWLLPGGKWWGKTYIGSWIAGEIMSAQDGLLLTIGRAARGKYALDRTWWDMFTDQEVKEIHHKSTQLDSLRKEYANEDLKAIKFTAEIYEKDLFIFFIPHPDQLNELAKGIPADQRAIFKGLEGSVIVPKKLGSEDYHSAQRDPYRHFNDRGHEKFYELVNKHFPPTNK